MLEAIFLYVASVFFFYAMGKEYGEAGDSKVKKILSKTTVGMFIFFWVVGVWWIVTFFFSDSYDLYKELRTTMTLALIGAIVSIVLSYIAYKRGLEIGKKTEREKRELAAIMELERRDLAIDPEQDSNYWNWEVTDVSQEEYSTSMVVERIREDIAQSMEIFESHERICQYKKALEKLHEIFAIALVGITESEPRRLEDAGSGPIKSIKLVSVVENTPVVYFVYPWCTGPEGLLHKRGQIQVGNETVLKYELSIGKADETQWWKLNSPERTFGMTTKK
ncbi:MAG: hypothetical protein IJ762_05120 [Bacteroidaceae bacterium]|nr:hypothetical protein [Bacteroidaceae bacterium]